jgi:hypothetical protein
MQKPLQQKQQLPQVLPQHCQCGLCSASAVVRVTNQRSTAMAISEGLNPHLPPAAPLFHEDIFNMGAAQTMTITVLADALGT